MLDSSGGAWKICLVLLGLCLKHFLCGLRNLCWLKEPQVSGLVLLIIPFFFFFLAFCTSFVFSGPLNLPKEGAAAVGRGSSLPFSWEQDSFVSLTAPPAARLWMG